MSFTPIDYYNADWGTVDHRRPVEPRERLAIELIRPLAQADTGRFLDVGCGSGIFMRALDQAAGLSERGWTVAGVDISDHALGSADGLPYEFAQANLEEGIPGDDASHDLLYAGEVIEHVYNPDALLRECHRVLRPGGHLIVTTPNIQAWYNRILFPLGIQPVFYETSTKSTAIGAGPIARIKHGTDPVGHLRLFNRRALVDILSSEGFEAVKVHGEVFAALPRPAQWVDRVFSRRPSLASILVVVARRRG